MRKEPPMQSRSKKIAVCGLLSALALVLSALEGMLPPIPGLPLGAKPGLSNIVTMFAAGSLGLPCALAVAMFKGGFAFLTRGVTAGLMSLSGGLLSTFAMWLVWKRTRFSLLFTGVCGALAHNTAQLCVALLLTGSAALFYIPALLLLSLACGVCTGLVLQLILPLLQKLPKN